MPFSVQIFKLKISFCDIPERKHGLLLKNTVKNARRKKLIAIIGNQKFSFFPLGHSR
jgi:hypothetical protein